MPYMPEVRCPKCGTEFSALLYKCPGCGKRRTMENDKDFTIPETVPAPVTRPAELAAQARAIAGNRKLLTLLATALLVLGLGCGGMALALLHPWTPAAEPIPSVVETLPPTPTPTPTPTINSIRVYAFSRELTEGFTAYVGDEALTLTVEIEPTVYRPSIRWTVSDKESASLSVSQDGSSCEYKALKPSGKNELTVSCYGAELVIPVYLWEH